MQDEGRKHGVSDQAQQATFNPDAALNAAHKRNAEAQTNPDEPGQLDAEREAAIKAAEQKASSGRQKPSTNTRTTKNGQNASPDGQSQDGPGKSTQKDGHEIAREDYEAQRSGQQQSRGGLLGAMDALGTAMASRMQNQQQGAGIQQNPQRGATRVEAPAQGQSQGGQAQGGLGGMNPAAMAEALAATKGAVSKMQERGDTITAGKPGQQQARPGAAISDDKAAQKQQGQGAGVQ